MPRKAAVLEVRGLARSYGTTVAVRKLDLKLAAGDVVGLLGPNGAGKTTSISCIAGLLTPDVGEVRVLGSDVRSHNHDVRRGIGLATQALSVYPGLSVRANLRFFGRLGGLGVSAVDASIERIERVLQIGALVDRRVSQLSVGQQRIAHVACAFAHRPSLLLLDEPTAGLDVSARQAVLNLVRIVADEGAAVLFSSHNMTEVQDLCPKVVIINGGEVIAAGAVARLIDKWGDPRVEMRFGAEVVVTPGSDLAVAIKSLDGRQPDTVRVVHPSLEAVFLRLTGLRVDASGEVAA